MRGVDQEGGKRGTFWNARDELTRSGRVVQDGKPYILHLIKEEPANGPAF